LVSTRRWFLRFFLYRYLRADR